MPTDDALRQRKHLGVNTTYDAVHVLGNIMDPDDILLWPDGFWCFREEFDPRFLRGNNYRVVESASDEGQRILAMSPGSFGMVEHS